MSLFSRRFTKCNRAGGAVAASLMLWAAAAGCGTTSPPEEAMPTRDITEVMEAHTQELLAIEGVTGVAIGQTDDGTPCILILILEESPTLKAKIPRTLEGHPVRTLVTGKIVPLGGSDSG
jgi:hypothetical protein